MHLKYDNRTIELIKSSHPCFDKKLEQFRDKVSSPQILKKANEILSKAGLPKKK